MRDIYTSLAVDARFFRLVNPRLEPIPGRRLDHSGGWSVYLVASAVIPIEFKISPVRRQTRRAVGRRQHRVALLPQTLKRPSALTLLCLLIAGELMMPSFT